MVSNGKCFGFTVLRVLEEGDNIVIAFWQCASFL